MDKTLFYVETCIPCLSFPFTKPFTEAFKSVQMPLKKCSRVNTFLLLFVQIALLVNNQNLLKLRKMKFFEV
jgi:hypothetical protein